jgi:hypothetical protein
MFLTEVYVADIDTFNFLSESEMEDIVSKNVTPEEHQANIKILEAEINKNANSSELILFEKMKLFVSKLVIKIKESNFFNYIANVISSVIQKFKDEVKRLTESSPLQITAGIGCVILTTIINSSIFVFLSAILPPTAAFLVLAVVVSPLVEEGIRFSANKMNSGSQYTAALNIAELFIYTPAIILASPSKTVIGKIWTVVKTKIGAILKYTINNTIQISRIEKDKDDTKPYLVTVLIHFMWNFAATLKHYMK